MADEKKIDPFKPNQPTIPGVSPAAAKSPGADAAAGTSERPQTAKPNPYAKGLPTWLVLALVSVLFVIIVGLWWTRRVPAEIVAPAAAANTADVDAAPAKPAETLPVGPGEVATTDELAKPWAAKRFVYKDAANNLSVPAVVVHLPNGIYWGVSLREPFGSCEMLYMTDLEKLRAQYNFRAEHPMVVDPCNRTVFDLMKYGSGPNGLVRGEIVSGAAVRPPIAIEMKAQDRKVVAGRME